MCIARDEHRMKQVFCDISSELLHMSLRHLQLDPSVILPAFHYCLGGMFIF